MTTTTTVFVHTVVVALMVCGTRTYSRGNGRGRRMLVRVLPLKKDDRFRLSRQYAW